MNVILRLDSITLFLRTYKWISSFEFDTHCLLVPLMTGLYFFSDGLINLRIIINSRFLTCRIYNVSSWSGASSRTKGSLCRLNNSSSSWCQLTLNPFSVAGLISATIFVPSFHSRFGFNLWNIIFNRRVLIYYLEAGEKLIDEATTNCISTLYDV